MNANDIIEKCAEICDRYAVKNHEAAVKASRRASRLLEIDSVQRETAEIGSVECESAALEAAAIANEIRALKSSLPADTVSEEMVEQAREIVAENSGCSSFRCFHDDECACRDVSRQILALAHADDGWRPIEDGVPEDRETVLLFVAQTYRKFCVVGYHLAGCFFLNSDGCAVEKHVTHWRPLPAPPKDGRE